MEELSAQISQIIQSVNSAAFLVDVQLKRGKISVLTVKVDTDKGISLAECATISRAIGKELDSDERFDFSYKLEVSSPGIGYPLKLHRQYLQNIGRFLKVVLTDHQDIRGKLVFVNDTGIGLEPLQARDGKKKQKQKVPKTDPVQKEIDFKDIKESKVIIV